MIWVLRLLYPKFGFPKWILALGSPRVCLVIGLGHLDKLFIHLGESFIHLDELFIHLGDGCLVHGSYQGFKVGLHGWTRLGCRLLVFGS